MSVSRGSRSRRTKGESRPACDPRPEAETAIHVLDNGIDRTPLPLQKTTKPSGIPHESYQSGSFISALLPVDGSSIFHSSMLNSSVDQSNLMSNVSLGSPSQTGLLTASSSLTSMSVDRRTSNMSSGSVFALPPALRHGGSVQLTCEDCVISKPRVFTNEERRIWFEGKTTVVLTETPTIMLYTHQDELVLTELRSELNRVQQRNADYAALVEAKRVDEGTRFQEKGLWTFLTPKKSIHCSIHPPRKKNAGALQITPWMLRDQFTAFSVEETEVMQFREDESQEEDDELAETTSEPEKDAVSETTADQSTRSNLRPGTSWMFADSLLSTLRVMERAVVQNTMEEVQLSYRGIMMDPLARRVPRASVKPKKDLTEETDAAVTAEGQEPDEAATPSDLAGEVARAGPSPLKMSQDIKSLWTFRSPLTTNRSVTCMAWNCKESDVLAVGYSARRGGDEQNAELMKNPSGGFVCFWSLKNPLAPERVIQLSSEAGVSAVAFSYEHPSLLAVGNTEGDVVIYDIQKETDNPAITTTITSGQHTGAVWELKWVACGKERGEFLMSISGDGRVVQWAVGKTIERVAPDLMTLKRQHNAVCESFFAENSNTKRNGAQDQRRKHDALFSRQCGGMCLDVSPADNTVYIVGTEDGSIYQCNKSQTENYELSYAPHSELVYRVRWSPFSDYYFLTCSADWSSRLYRFGRRVQLLTFDSPNQNAVQDVAWSFTNSTYFATVTAQGKVEVWSITDPIHPSATAQFLDQRRLTNVLFAEQEAPVIVVGDEKGDVTVFRLLAQCYGNLNLSSEEQERQLEEAISKATS